MKKSNVLWGILLIALGLIFALNTLVIAQIDLFFDGFWTLFIIIPCAVGLFTEKEKTGNLIGLAVGILLLLCCQDILSFEWLWKLLVPCLIIFVGIRLLYRGIRGEKITKAVEEIKKNSSDRKTHCAAFSGLDASYAGQNFDGAELIAVFGGVECDLREALLVRDCAVQVTAVFGGIDILVPPNVRVVSNATCLFGGVDLSKRKDGSPTLYVSGLCLFGGVDIK